VKKKNNLLNKISKTNIRKSDRFFKRQWKEFERVRSLRSRNNLASLG